VIERPEGCDGPWQSSAPAEISRIQPVSTREHDLVRNERTPDEQRRDLEVVRAHVASDANFDADSDANSKANFDANLEYVDTGWCSRVYVVEGSVVSPRGELASAGVVSPRGEPFYLGTGNDAGVRRCIELVRSTIIDGEPLDLARPARS
jgi:hypothetical protein